MTNLALPSLTAASALTGSEILHLTQSGNSRRTTAQAIADLAAGASGNTVEDVTGTTYTTVIADFNGGKIKRMNNAAAQTVTVAPSLSGNQSCFFYQFGAGSVTFAAGAGVTIHSLGDDLAISGRYGSVALIRTGTDEYLLVGALA